MTKTLKSILCILLSAVLLTSTLTVAFAEQKTDCDGTDYFPTIIIPGLFQSQTYLYNDDGTVNENYEEPFFLDSTVVIIVKALFGAFLPLVSMLLTQSDSRGTFATAFAKTLGNIICERIKSDENGKFVYNIDAAHYNYSFAECSEEEQNHILSCIPISAYFDIAGEDHMYFFSYCSFGNIASITDELYEFIEMVKEETGHDKVNIVPISQGGTLCNYLLEYYPQVYDDLNRIIYVVPALDGSSLISDIYTEGLLDDDDALYGYMLPSLIDDELTGNLINLALRIIPKDVLNDTLDVAVDYLIENYLKNSTCLWALVTQEDYPTCREKYLSGDENAEIRSQTDAYYQAQVNSDANILKAIDAGVEVFNIVNYNYSLYAIVDSWDEVNADGIIQLDSTSMGAYSLGVNVELPDGYVQQGNSYDTCSDPENHNHIDPYNIVDASTGLLPDHTFYFYNGDHERTGSNDALVALVVRLLTDETFTDVYSYPDEFPQFNNARNTKSIRNTLKSVEKWDFNELSEEDAAELEASIEQVYTMLSHTNVDLEETEQAQARFYIIYNKICGIETKEDGFFTKLLNKTVSVIADFVDEKIGAQGYSDALK